MIGCKQPLLVPDTYIFDCQGTVNQEPTNKIAISVPERAHCSFRPKIAEDCPNRTNLHLDLS